MSRLLLRVSPKASRNAITGWRGDRLKLSVTAAPEAGKANAAVLRLLAGALGLRRSQLRVLRGQSSPDKQIEIDLPEAELRARLAALTGGAGE